MPIPPCGTNGVPAAAYIPWSFSKWLGAQLLMSTNNHNENVHPSLQGCQTLKFQSIKKHWNSLYEHCPQWSLSVRRLRWCLWLFRPCAHHLGQFYSTPGPTPKQLCPEGPCSVSFGPRKSHSVAGALVRSPSGGVDGFWWISGNLSPSLASPVSLTQVYLKKHEALRCLKVCVRSPFWTQSQSKQSQAPTLHFRSSPRNH